MEALTRDAILSKEDIITEKLEVPEWGGYVFVKGLTGTERDEWDQMSADRRKGKGKRVDIRGMTVKLVALSTYDENGKKLFGGRDDEAKLHEKSAAAINRIFKVAQRLSGLSDEDVEELASDLEDGPSESSG